MKLIAWFGRIIFIVCFVCCITLFTTWQVVNVYVQKFLEPLQLEVHLPQTGFAEFVGHLYTSLLLPAEKQSPQDSLQAVLGDQMNDSNHDGGGVAAERSRGENQAGVHDRNHGELGENFNDSMRRAPGEEVEETDLIEQEGRPQSHEHGDSNMEDAVAVWSQQRGSQSQAGAGGQILITEQQFIEAHQNMSSEDKMRILTLVLQKLPQHEMQELSNLMEDGLTAEEIAHLEQTIAKYLNDEEMEELLEIIQKY